MSRTLCHLTYPSLNWKKTRNNIGQVNGYLRASWRKQKWVNPSYFTMVPHLQQECRIMGTLAGGIKDAIIRHQTMQGRYVERRFGWDCQGVPIEQIIEKNAKEKGA